MAAIVIYPYLGHFRHNSWHRRAEASDGADRMDTAHWPESCAFYRRATADHRRAVAGISSGRRARGSPSQETPSSDGDKPQSQTLPPLASPAPPRSYVKRLIRPALGIGLLGLAAWSLVPLLFNVCSTQAVVNAPVVTLRSPIDGTVTFLCRTASGAKASANTALFKVRNALADDDRLDALKDEKVLLQRGSRAFASNMRASSLCGTTWRPPFANTKMPGCAPLSWNVRERRPGQCGSRP